MLSDRNLLSDIVVVPLGYSTKVNDIGCHSERLYSWELRMAAFKLSLRSHILNNCNCKYHFIYLNYQISSHHHHFIITKNKSNKFLPSVKMCCQSRMKCVYSADIFSWYFLSNYLLLSIDSISILLYLKVSSIV